MCVRVVFQMLFIRVFLINPSTVSLLLQCSVARLTFREIAKVIK